MTRTPKLAMSGKQLVALREKHHLTQVQIAQLLRKAISKRRTGSGQSDQVGKWESGIKPIPAASAELIRAKLYLIEAGHVTYDQLIEYSLDELLCDIYS